MGEEEWATMHIVCRFSEVFLKDFGKCLPVYLNTELCLFPPKKQILGTSSLFKKKNTRLLFDYFFT